MSAFSMVARRWLTFEADVRWLKHYGFGALEQPNLASGIGRS